MPDWLPTIAAVIITAVIAPIVTDFLRRRRNVADTELVEAQTADIEAGAAAKFFVNQQDQIEWLGTEHDKLQKRLVDVEVDKRDRMAETAKLYETLMSAIGRNRYLEAEMARLVRFVRTRYPDVYAAYQAEFGDVEVSDDE